MNKFYKIETWMSDSQAMSIMAYLEATNADVIGICVERECRESDSLGDAVLMEDAQPAEVRDGIRKDLAR